MFIEGNSVVFGIDNLLLDESLYANALLSILLQQVIGKCFELIRGPLLCHVNQLMPQGKGHHGLAGKHGVDIQPNLAGVFVILAILFHAMIDADGHSSCLCDDLRQFVGCFLLSGHGRLLDAVIENNLSLFPVCNSNRSLLTAELLHGLVVGRLDALGLGSGRLCGSLSAKFVGKVSLFLTDTPNEGIFRDSLFVHRDAYKTAPERMVGADNICPRIHTGVWIISLRQCTSGCHVHIGNNRVAGGRFDIRICLIHKRLSLAGIFHLSGISGLIICGHDNNRTVIQFTKSTQLDLTAIQCDFPIARSLILAHSADFVFGGYFLLWCLHLPLLFALVAVNDSGVITVFAHGSKPTEDITLDAVVLEVTAV